MTLIVNAFYGATQDLGADSVEADIVIDLSPFNYVHKGECPAWLADSVGQQMISGIVVPSNNKRANHRPRHVDGEQISRGINFYAMMKQLELLRTLSKDLECTIEVRISRSGKIGKFGLRFLVGLEDVAVNFINFPVDWTETLRSLEPVPKLTVNMNPERPQHGKQNSARIVSFRDEPETQPVPVTEAEKAKDRKGRPEDKYAQQEQVAERRAKDRSIPKAPAVSTDVPVREEPVEEHDVEATDPVPTPVVKPKPKTRTKPEETKEEVAVAEESLEPEVPVEVAKPKRTPRKKAVTPVVEEVPEVVEPVTKPKRTPRKKAVTPASEEALESLGTKFATSTRK